MKIMYDINFIIKGGTEKVIIENLGTNWYARVSSLYTVGNFYNKKLWFDPDIFWISDLTKFIEHLIVFGRNWGK